VLLNEGKTTFDRDDELGKDRQKFVGTFFDEFISTLTGQKLIGIFSLSQSLEENGQVKMIIEVLGFHFPRKLNHFSFTFRRAPWKLTATGRSPR
jgi:hypothetical protein